MLYDQIQKDIASGKAKWVDAGEAAKYVLHIEEDGGLTDAIRIDLVVPAINFTARYWKSTRVTPSTIADQLNKELAAASRLVKIVLTGKDVLDAYLKNIRL